MAPALQMAAAGRREDLAPEGPPQIAVPMQNQMPVMARTPPHMRAAVLQEETAQIKLLTTSAGGMPATGAAAGIKVHWGAPVTAARLDRALAAARQTAAAD